MIHGKWWLHIYLQGCSQNLKQVPQNFMEAFNVDDVTLTFQLMTSYRKINIARENIVNYRVTSPSNHCCQISFIVWERPRILVIIHFFVFLRHQNKLLKLLPVYSYVCMLKSPYQYDKKLLKHFPANIYLFKVRIVLLRYSESESFLVKSHWCARLGFGTQTHYEAPDDFQVILEIMLWLTLGEWDCLLLVVQSWP